MVRGAESIDKHIRIEGLDWFANEELSYSEQLEAFDEYIKVKPEIVVSHDCPQSVMEKLFGYPEKSQTRTMLEMMFQEHQPQLWVFGHHHRSKDVQINGTRFVCLNELETMTLEL
jgi:Icc-related predicted phosphoesterase